LTQVPVEGAVPTKEQDDVCLIPGGGLSDAPVDCFVGLEGSEIFRGTSQPENDSRTHMRA
jgi:hypothetical protein